MFNVKHKETGEIRTVYAMTGISFLFYDEELETWIFDAMSNYEPVKAEG